MPANAERILASCSLFSAVSGPSRDRLVRMALLHAFSRGEHIFYEGDTNPAVYVVGSGLVRVYKLSPAGKEHVLHFAGPGSSFAEVLVERGAVTAEQLGRLLLLQAEEADGEQA